LKASVTAIGNEGFRVESGDRVVWIDAFYRPILSVGSAPAWKAEDVDRADLILVTHVHWDHFEMKAVVQAATRTGAMVVGPALVTDVLQERLRPEQVMELEPPERKAGKPGAATAEAGGATVTALRTFHSRGHNSYRVELPGFTFFHDGDNEDTRRIDAKALGRIDALFIGPWQGSGWVDFVEALSPRRWFLMHLNDEELEQHARGAFLPDLCDHIPLPDRLVVLRPDESCEMP